MHKQILVTVAALVVVAAGVAWLTTDHSARIPDETASGTPRGIDTDSTIRPAVTDSVPSAEAERNRVLDNYFEPLRFHEDLTAFLDTVPERRRAENVNRLEALSRRIRDYQQAGYLALSQARYLEGALITAIFQEDEAARRLALEDLRAEYADLAEPPSTAHLDARFETYKAREALIVRDVLDNPPPKGMTQDAWLRERLDVLRAEVYGEE